MSTKCHHKYLSNAQDQEDLSHAGEGGVRMANEDGGDMPRSSERPLKG